MSRQRGENHFDGNEQRTTILDTAPAGIAQSIQAVELSMVGAESTAPCDYLSARRFFALRAALTPVATPLRVLRAPGSLAKGQTPHRPAILPSCATGRKPLHRSITKSRSGGAAKTG
jgi:hypothetical protein